MSKIQGPSIAVVFLLLGAALLVTSTTQAQIVPEPRVSPRAELTQRVHLTDIAIEYHRPGVKGRTFVGDKLPYGEVWRAGANENTTIEFLDPVKVNGNPLPAGKYGLHVIPQKDEMTVIFSKDNVKWGSYSYDEKNDALRVTAEIESAPHTENLLYYFDNVGENMATVYLQWEEWRIGFDVEVPKKTN